MKSVFTIVLALGAIASLTACDLTVGSGYVSSGVYGSDDYYSSWDRPSTHDREDNWHSDRQERKERDAYERQTPNDTSDLNPPGVKPRHSMLMSLEQNSNTSVWQSTDSRVITVAKKYDISHYAATYIVRALALADMNDDSGIKDLGLKVSDMKRIAKGKSLDSQKLEAMSNRLLMSTESVEQLLFDMKNDIKHAHSK